MDITSEKKLNKKRYWIIGDYAFKRRKDLAILVYKRIGSSHKFEKIEHITPDTAYIPPLVELRPVEIQDIPCVQKSMVIEGVAIEAIRFNHKHKMMMVTFDGKPALIGYGQVDFLWPVHPDTTKFNSIFTRYTKEFRAMINELKIFCVYNTLANEKRKKLKLRLAA